MIAAELGSDRTAATSGEGGNTHQQDNLARRQLAVVHASAVLQMSLSMVEVAGELAVWLAVWLAVCHGYCCLADVATSGWLGNTRLNTCGDSKARVDSILSFGALLEPKGSALQLPTRHTAKRQHHLLQPGSSP